MDSDLGSFAGLTRNGLDLDSPLVDLGDLELEKLDKKVGMGPGEDHLGPLGGPEHVDQRRPDRVALSVALLADLLLEGDDGLGPTHIDEDVPVADLLDRTTHHLADAPLEVLVDPLAFGLTHPLDQDLLGRLDRVPAEVGKGQFLLDLLADLRLWIDLLGGG